MSADQWNWSEEFRPNTDQHLLVVVVSALIIFTMVFIGRTLLGKAPADEIPCSHRDREYRFRRWIGWSIVLSQTVIFVRRFMPGHWDVGDSLPLHLCRWSVWIAAWMMLTMDRRARSLSVFWGIGLSAQVFITPFLRDGHGSLGFWIYWLNHVQIVGVAVYDIVVLGYRPNLKDLRFAIVCGLGFCALVFVMNLILGTNYSYLGDGQHAGKSLIDYLGPYPWRAAWLTFSAGVILTIVYLISSGMLLVRTRVFGKDRPRFIESNPSTPDDG